MLGRPHTFIADVSPRNKSNADFAGAKEDCSERRCLILTGSGEANLAVCQMLLRLGQARCSQIHGVIVSQHNGLHAKLFEDLQAVSYTHLDVYKRQDQITRMLLEYKRRTKKPIYAHVDGLGASGAYYIASAADEINVAPTSMTGSIGVIMQSVNVRGLMDKVGVEFRTFKTGKHKDMLSPFRDVTEEETAFVEAQLGTMHERFVQQVLAGRGSKIKEDVLRGAADGSVYTAEQATERGLVDSTSYAEDYLDKLAAKNQGKTLFISYLPPGREYNLFNMMRSQSKMNWIQSLETLRPQGLQVMYLWDGF